MMIITEQFTIGAEDLRNVPPAGRKNRAIEIARQRAWSRHLDWSFMATEKVELLPCHQIRVTLEIEKEGGTA